MYSYPLISVKKVTSMKIRKRMIIDTKIHLILWSCSSGVHPDTCNSTREGKKKKKKNLCNKRKFFSTKYYLFNNYQNTYLCHSYSNCNVSSILKKMFLILKSFMITEDVLNLLFSKLYFVAHFVCTAKLIKDWNMFNQYKILW